MVLINPIVSQRGLDTGSAPNIRVSDAIGQGVRQIGAALQQFATQEQEFSLRRERMAAENEAFRTDQEFRRFSDDFSLEFSKRQQDIDPSGEGLATGVAQDFDAKSREFLGKVPDRLKPRFSEIVTTAREGWVNKASATEIDQRNRWFRTGIAETQERLQGQVFNDPELFSAARDDGLRAIEASGLPPTEKEVLRKAWDETLAVTVGEREIRDAERNPATAGNAAQRLGVRGASGDPVDQVVSRIIGVESAGNPNAKNPKSSAAGLGQFIDSTWLAMIRKNRPDVAAGRSAAEILALKTDPALSREMTKAYTVENGQFLTAQGIQTTPGNLYLAHFLGPRGAAQVLKADKSTPIANIVGADVVRANSFLAGKTAGQVAEWSNRKMGRSSTEVMDPRYAPLSLDKRLELYDKTVAAAARGEQAIRAEATANYNAHKGSMELGIENGQVASERTILGDAILTDAHKADLLRTFRTRQGDALAVQAAVEQFAAGNFAVDAYSSEGRKLVDKTWTAISAAVPADRLQPTVEDMVRQTGTVPQSVVNMIRRGLTSQAVEDVVQAAQAAQRIASVDPAALGRRDGGSEAQTAADDFAHYINRLNLSPEEAARRMVEARKPENKVSRKALEPAAKEFAKEIEKENVGALFSGWFSTPEVGFNPGQALGIKADYAAIAEDQFYAANGDPEIARNRAVEQMKRLYGVTEVSGRKVVMKHPPEFYWPKFRHSAFGEGMDYARLQLENDLKQFAPDIDMGTVQMVTTPETDAMVKRGEMPGYAVVYKDSNGMLQTIPGRLWRPDVSDKAREQADRDAREQASREENARRMQGAAQQDMQRLNLIEQRQRETGDMLRGGPMPTITPTPYEPTPMQPETFSNQQRYLGSAREDSPLGRAISRRQRQLRQDAEDDGTLPSNGPMP